jgi:hypothetical protein
MSTGFCGAINFRLELLATSAANYVRPSVMSDTSKVEPPVIKTRLHFKRQAPNNPSTFKRRKTQGDKAPKTNGAPSPNPQREPDFDFTNDDDPPLPKISKVFWPDKYTFKDALFAAQSDPDDALHWAEVFGTEIHVYPRPRPSMTDDDYANWVREQVYAQVLRESNLKKRQEAERERLRQQARERRERDEREKKLYDEWRKREQEFQKKFEARFQDGDSDDYVHEFTPNNTRSPGHNKKAKDPAQRWKEYVAAFQPPLPNANIELLLLWQRNDVPWPTPSGLEKDISEANVRAFIRTYTMKYSDQAAGDWKKAVKQNQYFWHPDKFRQIQARKLERLSEEKKGEIMQRVTEVSQILNKLAKE